MFGRQATEKLAVVECAPDGRNSQKALCDTKKIEGYPSWEIKGVVSSGKKTLDQLADQSGYTGSRSF